MRTAKAKSRVPGILFSNMGTLRLFNNHIPVSFALLAVTETLVFLGAVYLAVAIRFGTMNFQSAEILASINSLPYQAILFTVVHMLSMTALGLYQTNQFWGRNSFLQMVSRILVGMVLAAILLMVIYYLIPYMQLGRGVTALAFLLATIGIIFTRKFFLHYVDQNVFTSRVVVVGAGHRAASLINGELESGSSFKLTGFISLPDQPEVVPSDRILAMPNSLLAHAKEIGAHEIVVALDDRRKGYPAQQLLACKMGGIRIIDPVSFLEREQGKVDLAMLNPSWMIFSDGFSVSAVKSGLSRLFDIIASLAILILTFPVLLITAFLVAMESGFKEPVFYKQERVGKNGENFQLLKFRSMKVDAEKDGAVWATKNDARVTTIGKFIRKVRIDELPQIINILKGDMRLVGPRPERPEFVEKLSQSISMYSQRHTVKPGLAGWAQLKYPYGASEEDAYQKLQYDLYYIKNANPVMDFFILLQTLEIVIFGKGAR